jgi:hypothetical protein
MNKSPFDADTLDDIFKFDLEHEDRLASRESGKLDFKESFNLGSADEYARTMAAFANTAGGYLVFGVKDKPRTLIGLKNDNFDSVDPAKVTQALNERFAPEINWEPLTHTVREKKVGIIYVREASRKPVVCLRAGKELQEGAIYYRYRGRTEKIRYPELRELLDGELRRERELWMRHVQKMAKLGIENVGVLSTVTGEVSGSQASFLIPEDLLAQIKFINSGTFVESGGAPTLKVIGEAETIPSKFVQPTKMVRQPLHGPDILSAFIHQEKALVPMDYVSHVCFEAAAYYPVHFFISQTPLTIAEVVKEIEKVSSRNKTKARLLKRLQNAENLTYGQLGGAKEAATKRKAALDKIVSKTITEAEINGDLRAFFQALTHLDRNTGDKDYVLSLLDRVAMPRYTSLDGSELQMMRQAICHLDIIWFREAVNGSKIIKPAPVAGKTIPKAS